MGRSLVRNIVGQRQTTINFRRAIENREVIFIKLPLKTVPQDARLIGTILQSEIHAGSSRLQIPQRTSAQVLACTSMSSKTSLHHSFQSFLRKAVGSARG